MIASDKNPEPWSKLLACAIIDSVEGRRDVRTLSRWIARDLFPKLTSCCAELEERHPKPARAHSARSWQPSPGVAEVAVTLWDRDRLRAVAMRLERPRNRWLVTALEFA